jgi:mRNA interferase MazF
MSRLRRGMVIDVNLEPTKGSETGKVRPCVIVTNNTYNARVPVIQVVPLTAWSARKARIITNVEVVPSSRNGLTKNQWRIACKHALLIIAPASSKYVVSWKTRS